MGRQGLGLWLILFFIAAFIDGTLATAEPVLFKTHIRGDALSSGVSPLRLSIRTPEGIESVFLRRLGPAIPSRVTENGLQTVDSGKFGQAVVYRGFLGERRRGKVRRAVTATIVGTQLRILFNGRERRNRFYLVRQNLSSPTQAAQLAHLPASFTIPCATSAASSEGVAAGSVASIISNAVYSPTRSLDISTDADFEFFQTYGSNSNAQIQSILASVETIFLGQLGIRLNLQTQNVFNTSSQPYTSTGTGSGGLLEEFQEYKSAHNHLGSPDIAHLFTAKNIDGLTLGQAYQALILNDNSISAGVVCRTEDFNVGFTQVVGDSIIQYLITAHEIGHNLSAQHPDEVLEDPEASLMDATADDGNTSFSDFSLNEITSYIDTHGSCVGNAKPRISLRSVTRSTSGRVTARVQLLGYLSGGLPGGPSCTTRLYAANSRTKLRGDFSRARLLIGRSSNVARTINMAKTLQNSMLTLFRAKVTCVGDSETTTALSSIKSL